MNLKNKRILGINISFYQYQEAIKKIINTSLNNTDLRVSPIASHSIIEAQNNSKLKDILNNFDLVLPDGQSLVWAANFLYENAKRERIYGPDLLLRLCERCEKEKIRVILYGNHTGLVSHKIRKKYPKLNTVALPDLKYKKINNTDVKYLLSALNKYKKSIAFIGIGSPAQHILLAELKQIKMPIVAVGAAFNFIAGVQKQAPVWMQKYGFEWLFRLINEPQRLWKRYLIYAPRFVILVIFQKINFLFNNDK
ncbi:MAG: WecB/TagA/CpsF family glycosyltransferase [Patescibacteria group bacterium]